MLSRRSALLGALSSYVALPHRLWAQPTSVAPGEKPPPVTILRVERRGIEVNGKPASALGIRQPDGMQGLVTEVGRRFRVRVDNALDAPTLIHWHGMAPPWRQDGVPGISGPPIAPGASAEYDFPLRFGGTFWMHSHEGLQEQSLLAAPLIIRDARNPPAQQEATIMLADFSFTPAAQIYEELRKKHAAPGLRAKKGEVRRPDLNDVRYDAYLANDRTLDDPEVVRAEKGGLFRLRVINASAASNMWIDLGEISGELIAVDGQSIHPHRASRFPIAIAQRADIRLQLPKASGAWPVLFKAEGSTGQSGIILVAGDGAVAKISDQGEMQPAIGLEMEAQLRAMGKTSDTAVSRVEMLMLTGGGSDYAWGLNGMSSMHDVLFSVREGERYQVMFHNMTSMAHPMHLHGHYFKVVNINGTAIDGALRDTVLVPVDGMVTIQFDADNPGTWAFHCHHLYHMNAGMMGAIAYQNAA